MALTKVPQEVNKAHVSWQVHVIDATKHPQLGLESGEQTLGSMLLHVTARICLLGMSDERVHVSLHRPIAAGRVSRQATARVDRPIRCLLYRLDGEIAGRLDDDRPLATDPHDDRRSIFVIMPPARLALLAAPTCAASQRLLPPVFRWSLLTSRVIEFSRFPGALQLTPHLIRQRGIPQPPAPPLARTAMDPHLTRNAPGRTGKAQQQGGEYPVRQRPLALV
jgi:hypothetical protein